MFNESNFIIVSKYKKKFSCTCDICGSYRGYRYKEDANLPCYACAIVRRNQVHAFGVAGVAVVRVENNNKYQAFCVTCNKDRGFVDKKDILKNCRSCAATLSGKERYKNVDRDHVRLRHSMRSSIGRKLKLRHKSKAKKSITKILPYSLAELKSHLESLFYSDPKTGEVMSWDNYGSGWHIDHKTPDSWFVYSSTEDQGFEDSWALTNLQPMWVEENLKKSNKYSGSFKSG